MALVLQDAGLHPSVDWCFAGSPVGLDDGWYVVALILGADTWRLLWPRTSDAQPRPWDDHGAAVRFARDVMEYGRRRGVLLVKVLKITTEEP